MCEHFWETVNGSAVSVFGFFNPLTHRHWMSQNITVLCEYKPLLMDMMDGAFTWVTVCVFVGRWDEEALSHSEQSVQAFPGAADEDAQRLSAVLRSLRKTQRAEETDGKCFCCQLRSEMKL